MDLKGLKAMFAEKEDLPARSILEVTFMTVNEAIKNEGGKESIIKVDGAFRFIGGDTDWWEDRTTGVSRITDLTIEQWLDVWREKRDQ
jgi:hypothetical protein